MTQPNRLTVTVEGVGALGPGFSSWPELAAILRHPETYQPCATQLPVPALLPAAERRRAVPAVRLTLAAGLEAVAQSARDPQSLASVFASSGGDGQNIHAICAALAEDAREISPTRFHNSVHNAASGYWGIATGATAASTALCAFDGSFGAGLLEAVARVVSANEPVLLIAYDVDYPPPLHACRPIPDAFAVALVLAPCSAPVNAQGCAQLAVTLSTEPVSRLPEATLDDLRLQIPAARSLPLLAALAIAVGGEPMRLILDYLDDLHIAVEVQG